VIREGVNPCQVISEKALTKKYFSTQYSHFMPTPEGGLVFLDRIRLNFEDFVAPLADSLILDVAMCGLP